MRFGRWEGLQLLAGFLAVLYLLEALDLFLGQGSQPLNEYGIRPRDWSHLYGILLMPFLHDGFGHLAGNTLPMLVLGGMIVFHNPWRWIIATVVTTVVSGAAVFFLADPNTLHIGCSGLVFGYFGFLVAQAWFERSLPAIIVGLIVVLSYWGMLAGLSPFQRDNISWEGHLFGLLSGVITAWIICQRAPNLGLPQIALPLKGNGETKAASGVAAKRTPATKKKPKKPAPKKKISPKKGRSGKSNSNTAVMRKPQATRKTRSRKSSARPFRRRRRGSNNSSSSAPKS